MKFAAEQIIDRSRLLKLGDLGVDISAWWYKELLDNKGEFLPVVFKENEHSSSELFVCCTANLFSLPRAVRGYMCQGLYTDIDAVSAHPSVLIHLFNMVGITPPAVLLQWANDRKTLIANLLPGFEEDDAKEWLLRFLNKETYDSDCPRELKVLHHAIYSKGGVHELIQPLLPDVNFEVVVNPKLIGKRKLEAMRNPKGKAFSRALRHFTKRLLISAVELSIDLGLTVDLLCHDGFMVRSSPPLPDNFCQQLSERVKRDVGGLQIAFKVKSHDLSLLESPPKRLKLAEEPAKRTRAVKTHHTLDPQRVHTLCAYYFTNDEQLGASDYLVAETNRSQLYEFLAEAQAGAQLSISYKVPETGGRLKCTPPLNLGTLPTYVRAFLVDGFFHDLDMVSSGARIACYLMRKHGVEIPHILKLWCEDRMAAMAALATDDKRTMDRCMMTDRAPGERKLVPVYEAIYCSGLLAKIGFASKCRGDNAAAKFFANAVQDIERTALMAAVRPLKGVAALCHDGFLIPVSEVGDVEGFLVACHTRVKAVLPLLDAKFVIKPAKHDLSWEVLVKGG